MDGIVPVSFAVVVLMFFLVRSIVRRTNSPEGKAAKKELDRLKVRGEAGFLSSLPTIYYFLAILCGIILLVGGLSTNPSDSEAGALIGYTVGVVLSMFAVGRVIQLLQQSRAALDTLIEIEKFKLKRTSQQPPVE